MDLKAETIGLAVMLELPLVIIDVQRAGPSTGMPTKTEQTDLLMAIHGRHGESPLPVIAAATPADCFDSAVEAVRIAVRYRTPVILLGDTFLANSSEPWRIPDTSRTARDRPPFRHRARMPVMSFCPTCAISKGARPWAIPGTPGLQHRIGGLEKENGSGNISYDPENHALMTQLRAREAGKAGQRAARAQSRRGRGCRSAGAWLGFHLRRRSGSSKTGARARYPDCDRASAPPRPTAAQYRRRGEFFRQGLDS